MSFLDELENRKVLLDSIPKLICCKIKACMMKIINKIAGSAIMKKTTHVFKLENNPWTKNQTDFQMNFNFIRFLHVRLVL